MANTTNTEYVYFDGFSWIKIPDKIYQKAQALNIRWSPSKVKDGRTRGGKLIKTYINNYSKVTPE